MTSLLSVNNLHVRYGNIHAVKGVCFEVREREIVSLIGSNGAGKTSILQALSGLLKSEGEIYLKGRELSRIKAFERVSLGLAQAPEGRGIFTNLSVFDNLLMGAYSRKSDQDLKIDLQKCFSLFPRLEERRSQMAGTLSGGEQQMLAISRALMSQPQVLLLDEPSLGLAPMIVAQIFQILQKLNSEGVTILLVEQNARMALKISHRAYVIETGTISLEGLGQELLNDDQVRRSYLGA